MIEIFGDNFLKEVKLVEDLVNYNAQTLMIVLTNLINLIDKILKIVIHNTVDNMDKNYSAQTLMIV